MECSRLMALGLAEVLGKWWDQGDPVRAGFAERMQLQVELEKVTAINRVLSARLARFPARQRKHYTPDERFEILTLMRTHGLSRSEVAKIFLVDAQTVGRWMNEALTDPDATTIGTLVRPHPPMRTYDDVVKRLVAMLDSLKVGGSQRIAQMLAQHGITIGRETVRRYRRRTRSPRPEPTPPTAGQCSARATRTTCGSRT